MKYHESVLLNEAVDALGITEGGTYVDVTYGGGGHSGEILSRMRNGQLYSFDQDSDATKNVIDDPRLTLIHANFRYLRHFMEYFKASPVDGILADLGISSHHIDQKSRGFSFAPETPLDMRMNPSAELNAAFLLNTYSVEQIAKILNEFGDVRRSYEIARRIVSRREEKAFEFSDDLIAVLSAFAVPGRENRFYAQVFQALRMEVNDEMGALQDMLEQSYEVLKPGGKLVIITFHSAEDRLVKNFLKKTGKSENSQDFLKGIQQTCWEIPDKKAIVPGENEMKNNNRSRSAQLRIAIRK